MGYGQNSKSSTLKWVPRGNFRPFQGNNQDEIRPEFSVEDVRDG